MAQRIVRRPSKDMQKFLKAGTTGRLLGSLERHMQTVEEEPRRKDILHPSSMAKSDWCPRAGYFQLLRADKGGVGIAQEKHSLVKQNIFDEGHFIHDKWQQRFWRQGVLHGKWECTLCQYANREHTWWATAPEVCPWMDHPRRFLKYREVPLEDKDLRIGGHSDGWVKDGKPDTLIEIKSVGLGSYRFDAPALVEQHGEDANALWRHTKRPFSSHIRQGQIYLGLAQRIYGAEAPKDIVFIYEFKVNQQVKEFVVPASPEIYEPVFDTAEDIVARLRRKDPAPECFTGHSCDQCKAYAE